MFRGQVFIMWPHHSATTEKLSNWASSKEAVPMAAQPFGGCSCTLLVQSTFPFSIPVAFWPWRGGDIVNVCSSLYSQNIMSELTSTVRDNVYQVNASVPDFPSASTACPPMCTTMRVIQDEAVSTSVQQWGVTTPTNIWGHFVGAINKNPEEDAFGTPHVLASFANSGCHKYATVFNILHEDVTCDTQILPVIQTNIGNVKI